MKTSHALIILAAAVIAQPFISKTLNGEWGKYPTRLDALAACEAEEAKGLKARVIVNGQVKYWQTRSCSLETNHFELRQQEARDYRDLADWNRAEFKHEVLDRFYF